MIILWQVMLWKRFFIFLLFSIQAGTSNGISDYETPWCHCLKKGSNKLLRFMTFNIWNSGRNVENGMAKIAKHILHINPDVVALQEVQSLATLIELTRLLGPNWSHIERNQSHAGVGILTRHTIIGQSPLDYASVRALVKISFLDGSSTNVNFWSAHLDCNDYGPYAACNKMVTTADQINAGEEYLNGGIPGRVKSIQTICNLAEFKKDLESTEQDMMILAGDMNSPSHLDWIDSTNSIHCNWVYEWPVSKIIIDHGFVDAFREIYPNPAEMPGNTWSPVQQWQAGWGSKIPEPQDRIDMIFYKSPHWYPIKAIVYAGSEPIAPKPNHWHNDWPSDHASVVIDFKPKV